MSTETFNNAFLGQIVDTVVEASAIAPDVNVVLSNMGVVPNPAALIVADNGSGVDGIDLSASQLQAMQYSPLVIESAANNAITLYPQGATNGNAAAYALQQSLNLTASGQCAFLKLSQTGTLCAITLNSSTPKAITANTDQYALICVQANIVGNASTSTCTITRSVSQFS